MPVKPTDAFFPAVCFGFARGNAALFFVCLLPVSLLLLVLGHHFCLLLGRGLPCGLRVQSLGFLVESFEALGLGPFRERTLERERTELTSREFWETWRTGTNNYCRFA